MTAAGQHESGEREPAGTSKKAPTLATYPVLHPDMLPDG